MATEEIFRLIDEMAAAGTLRLGLWGGEPLIRDDIGEIVEKAREKNFFVTMDTNGHLLPGKLDVIRKLDHVVIAYDGPEEAHESNRGRGTHKLALDAIRAASGIVRVWTITVLTKSNICAVEAILETARDEGFKATFQVLHHNDVLGSDYTDMMPSDEEVKNAIDKIIDAKKKGAPVASSMNYLNIIKNWPDLSMRTSTEVVSGRPCLAGKLYVNIDTDGNVYPCSLLVGKMPGSQALEKGFERAVNEIGVFDCKSCVASCFIEYNHLFSLHPGTVLDWAVGIRMGGRSRV
jgi:MoaA/NifB/PqqE/SkfB family radical SAM enzyme